MDQRKLGFELNRQDENHIPMGLIDTYHFIRQTDIDLRKKNNGNWPANIELLKHLPKGSKSGINFGSDRTLRRITQLWRKLPPEVNATKIAHLPFITDQFYHLSPGVGAPSKSSRC